MSLLEVQHLRGSMGEDSGYGLSDFISRSDYFRKHDLLDCRSGYYGSVVLYLQFSSDVRD